MDIFTDSYSPIIVMLASSVIQSLISALLAFLVGFDWLAAGAPHQQQAQQGAVQPTYAYQTTGSSMPASHQQAGKFYP
jgi:hypothetical protein